MSAGPVVRVLASGFGSGYAPIASGTFGTLVAIPFAVALAQLPLWAAVLIVAASIPFGAWVCHEASRGDESHDPGWIVIDEIVGYWVATVGLGLGIWGHVAAFFLFRLFDIIKPPPARWFDRNLRGGWGILLDDVAAGAMTWLVLWGLVRFDLL